MQHLADFDIHCVVAQRGSEKVQVGTPSFRIASAFFGSFSLCH
jgi:hypothetical protein